MDPAQLDDAAPPRRRPAVAIGLLLLILLLAAGLRLLHLSQQSFWLDEVMTVNMARRAVRSLTMSSTTPPLYSILMSYWVRLVPETEAMVRLPSLIFGIAAVALVFFIGRRLFGRRAGLAAALLLAVSPLHIHYSQEARAYSLMVMLALASWLLLIRVMDRESPLRLAAWVGTTALLLLSHNYAAFLVAAQVAFVLIWGRCHGIRLSRWLIGLGLVGLLFLPWIRVVLIMIEQLRNAEYWIRPAVFGDFVKLYRMMCSDSGWLMKIDLALLLAGLVWWRLRFGAGTERRHGRTAVPLLGLWLGVPVMLMITASIYLFPLYQHRYALAILPPFLLLVAWGAVGHGHRPTALVLVGLVLWFTVPGLVTYYYGGPNRNPWRETANLVSNLARPGDLVLFIAPQGREPFDHYYRGPELPTRLLSRYLQHAPEVERVVVNSARRSKRLWAVISHCQTGILEEILERRIGPGRLLEQWDLFGIRICCYRTDRFDPAVVPESDPHQGLSRTDGGRPDRVSREGKSSR